MVSRCPGANFGMSVTKIFCGFWYLIEATGKLSPGVDNATLRRTLSSGEHSAIAPTRSGRMLLKCMSPPVCVGVRAPDGLEAHTCWLTNGAAKQRVPGVLGAAIAIDCGGTVKTAERRQLSSRQELAR